MVYVLATGAGDVGVSFDSPMVDGRAVTFPGTRAANDRRSRMTVADNLGPGRDVRGLARCDPPQLAEVELLTRIAAGDRSALAALYRLHGDPVFSYLLTLCDDRGLAEEALQDTFVAVWRGAGAFERRAQVRTWLFAIARRQAQSKLRRRPQGAVDIDRLLGAPAPGPTPEEQALAGAALERLVVAIGRLGTLQREIVVLAFVHQLSYAEMAELLGVPIGTVRSRLAGARSQLTALLGDGES